MKFKHYVITRFNLKSDRADKSGRKVNNIDWLNHRCDLFEKYCLPSFDEQTNKNFTWCIFFDPDTPEEILERYSSYDFIKIVKGEQVPGNSSLIVNHMRQLTKDEDLDRIITSRVDNDDSISKYYIEGIQQIAKNIDVNEKRVINYNNGLDYVLKGDYIQLVEKGDNYTNPFITFVEPYNNNQYVTVNDKTHGAMREYPVQYVHVAPMWMRIIHERNLLNSEWDFGKGLKRVHMSQVIEGGFSFLKNKSKV